jgi:hypothetical protein
MRAMGLNREKQSSQTPQRVLAFVQGNRAAAKLAGIKAHGGEALRLAMIRIDTRLPPIIDDGGIYLPDQLEADLVLDFLTHPDLSLDLAALCAAQAIPIVASGKKAAHPAVLALST